MITFGNYGTDINTTVFNNNGSTLLVWISTSSDNISSVTFGGSTMTSVTASHPIGRGRYTTAWYLTTAPQGNGTFMVTGGSALYIRPISINGGNQTIPVANSGTTQGTNSTSFAFPITIGSQNSYAIVGGIYGDTTTAGANTIQIDTINTTYWDIFRSTNTVSPGTTTLNINNTAAANDLAFIGFELISADQSVSRGYIGKYYQ